MNKQLFRLIKRDISLMYGMIVILMKIADILTAES